MTADPFRERVPPAARARARLLGGVFEFECESVGLRRLVDWAYAGLPRHRLDRAAPRLRVRLALAPRPRRQPRPDPPRIETLSGAGLLCATTSASSLALVSPEQRAALVVVSREMLRFRYHARYELLEFAVFTLATRVQGLIPLHAACVGSRGRGVLLMGESGAGKSTAALFSLLHGLEFLSEDSVFMTPDTLLATGVANFLHVRGDLLRLLPPAQASLVRSAAVIRRRSGVEKFEVDLRRPAFRLAAAPLELAAVVFLSARTAQGRLLVRLDRDQALARFEADQPYAATRPQWAVFRKRLAAIPAFELRRGRHPADAAVALRGVLADTASVAR